MTDNINNDFVNPFLDIKYNLTQNIVQDEEDLSDFQKTINENAIFLWKKHLADKVYLFLKTRDRINHIYFNYNFKVDWFLKVREKIMDSTNEIDSSEFTFLNSAIINFETEILKFLDIFGKLNCCMSNKIFLNILKNIYFTPIGTIDYVKTATCLIENTDIIDEDKYEIACYFCLKEKIEEYFEKIKENFGTEFIDEEIFRLRVFWTFHLRREDEEFNNNLKNRLSVIGETNSKHILQWAISNGNEVAVHYIWKNLCDDNLKRGIVTYIRYYLYYGSSINILCYLISQINQIEYLNPICRENGYEVLLKLCSSLRWRNYIENAANYLFNSINKMSFLIAMKTLIVLKLEMMGDRHSQKELIQTLETKFNVEIKMDYIFESPLIMNMLLVTTNENVVKAFLKIESDKDLKSSDNIDNVLIPIGKELERNEKDELFERFLHQYFNDAEIQNINVKF